MCLTLFISVRRALSSALLFIAGSSEPPSLITIFIIAYILSDPSHAFQLGSRGRRKPREETRCGTKKKLRRAHVVCVFARSCQSLQLCGAEELVPTAEELLCSCQLQLDVVAERRRVRRERATELIAPSHRRLQTSSRLEQKRRCDTFFSVCDIVLIRDSV